MPQARAEIAEYLRCLRAHESIEGFRSTFGLIVSKERIAGNGDYNLSGERYRENGARSHTFPLISLGDSSLFRIESGGTPKSDIEEFWNGGIAWATLVDLPATDFITQITETQRTISDRGLKESSAKMIPANSVVVSTRATIGRIAINRIPIATNQGFKSVVIEDSSRAVPEYVAFVLTKLVPTMKAWATGGTFAEISKSKFCELRIPLPPLEVQKEIVAEIEGYQKVIDGARAVLDNYRPHIPIHPDWPVATLGEICDVRDGTHDSPKYVLEGFPLVTSKNLKDGFIDFSDVNLISREDLDAINKRSKVDEGDILMPMIGTIGNPVIAHTTREYAVKNVALIKFHKDSKVDYRFLKDVLASAEMQTRFDRQASGSTQKFIPLGFIRALPIPLPPLATQQALAAEIEAEQALIAANRELIARFEKKIQGTLARVWGEDEPAVEEMETQRC
ncbi:MAG: hypothetical protein C3F08_06675 [Candidatus Methylomirabilota bacterium]|nr:MAG: hypothetical protein C3F08_06675 [candidate division NC10 bacterium]